MEAKHTDERRSEPRDVNEVIKDAMKNIAERSNKKYYTPEVHRETAAAIPQPMHKLDFEIGDVVQIRSNAKEKYIGRVGVIIGIRYKELSKAGPALVYTVKFSDNDSDDFLTDHFSYIRRADDAEI